MVIDPGVVETFEKRGHVLAKALFSKDETERYIAHYMGLRASGSYLGDSSGVDTSEGDPLLRYPRMLNMHRWDPLSLAWILDSRIGEWVTALAGREPLAVQTMLYFKPPASRGQALHQDQYYLKVHPGTCYAAWLALDPSDEDNGCLQVVPGTHDIPVLCPETADTDESFTDDVVQVPDNRRPEPIAMGAGDVLFFNGQLVHGSFPNRTKSRFRRSLIGHYIAGDAQQVARFYSPALRMDGSEVSIEEAPGGGPCGVWVNRAGDPEVEVSGRLPDSWRGPVPWEEQVPDSGKEPVPQEER